jgi:hypothetical protein
MFYPALHPFAIITLALGSAGHNEDAGDRTETVERGAYRIAVTGVTLVLLVAIAVHGGRSFMERRAISTLPRADSGTPNVLVIV